MSKRRDRPDSIDTTLDRDTDLDELRDGGPSETPGRQTATVAGSRRPDATRGRRPRPGAAPTTTGDATTGGMNTPTGMGTSDANSTGQVGGTPRESGSVDHAVREHERRRAAGS